MNTRGQIARHFKGSITDSSRRGVVIFSEPDIAGAAKSAALSPLVIPFASILAGPLVAAGLTIFTDGRPPSARFTILALSIGAAGWVMIQGAALTSGVWLSPMLGSFLRLGLLFLLGLLLFAIYVRSPNRLQQIDRKTLSASAVVILLLSALFWIARDTTWWSWLGS